MKIRVRLGQKLYNTRFIISMSQVNERVNLRSRYKDEKYIIVLTQIEIPLPSHNNFPFTISS